MNQVAIIGSPNSGKTLLFNRLTGLYQKVANFPGVTVELSYGALTDFDDVTLVDYPGAYSLQPISGDEHVAVENLERGLESDAVKAVLCVTDATRLEKGLYFTLQVIRECQRHNKPVMVLASMMDVLERNGLSLDSRGLAAQLGVPVVPVSGRTGEGLDDLRGLLASVLAGEYAVGREMASLEDGELRDRAHLLSRRFGPKGDLLIRHQARLDAFFLNNVFGGVVFFGIMYLLFQSIFTWAAPAMDAVETGLVALAEWVLPLIPSTDWRAFVKDALFGGIGAFLVFVPQIFVLTLVVGILEDSGYMARAAVICHKPLRFFGLTGKSFIPMLSGVACAIPAIYAARSIDSPRRRWLTYMAIPLMPCSARLPVYTLLIAAFIPAQTALGGLVGLQGLAMFGVYAFGILCGLTVSALMSRARADERNDLPFVLEMPPYRLPSVEALLRNAWRRSKHFVTKAGKVIFGVTVIVWLLGYFPNHGADLGASWLGVLGQLIEPIFAPLGLDWKYGVAILASFLAREVFVGTLGAMFGIEGAEENVVSLATQIQASGLSLASGVALLVYFVIALQCVSTLAVLHRESGSWKLPVQMLVSYCVGAYIVAFGAYHLVAAL